jgi:hypothetical protein
MLTKRDHVRRVTIENMLTKREHGTLNYSIILSSFLRSEIGLGYTISSRFQIPCRRRTLVPNRHADHEHTDEQ